MAFFDDISLRGVMHRFHLTFKKAPDLCATAPELTPNSILESLLSEYVPLALAIDNEKTRSELLIMPLLVEVRQQIQHRISLFSGIELSLDPDQRVSCVCDFLLSRSPQQQFLQAPIRMIVEANNDNLKSELGQCITNLVAAQLFNAREGTPSAFIFGAVTTGTNWWFLKLEGQTVYLDQK